MTRQTAGQTDRQSHRQVKCSIKANERPAHLTWPLQTFKRAHRHRWTKLQSQTVESEQLANQSTSWERAHYELFLLQRFWYCGRLVSLPAGSTWEVRSPWICEGVSAKIHMACNYKDMKFEEIHFLNWLTPNVFHAIAPHMFGWTGRARNSRVSLCLGTHANDSVPETNCPLQNNITRNKLL